MRALSPRQHPCRSTWYPRIRYDATRVAISVATGDGTAQTCVLKHDRSDGVQYRRAARRLRMVQPSNNQVLEQFKAKMIEKHEMTLRASMDLVRISNGIL